MKQIIKYLINIMIQIFVKTLEEKTLVYQINENIPISKLKQQLLRDKIVKTQDFFILKNGTLLKNNLETNMLDIQNNDTLYLQRRIKGGVIDIIIDCLIGLVKMFIALVSLIDEILDIIFKAFEIIPLIFNPIRLIDDILFGVSVGINKVMGAFIDSMDFSSANPKGSSGDGPFGTIDKGKPVCVPPTMINIIFLILCPPLALFLHSGIKGLFQVIVCSLLTLKAYYFPGLIYAALHILC